MGNVPLPELFFDILLCKSHVVQVSELKERAESATEICAPVLQHGT